jgi:hypothetical protein
VGKKHQYSEFYRCYYRWRPCSSNKEFGQYIGRAAVKAIEEAGADFIHFDNSAQMPCYCDKCRSNFPKHLIDTFPAEGGEGTVSFKERFGYDFNGTFELPRGTARQPIDNMPATAFDAGLYEWVRWRQRLYEETFKTACEMVRKASDEAMITWNIAGVDDGEFSGLVWGIDADSAYRLGTDIFYSEDANSAGMDQDRLIGHIRTYKYGRAVNNRVMVHNEPTGVEAVDLLSYAEAAVFNDGCLGRVMWATDLDTEKQGFIKKSLKFFRNHKNIYLKAKAVSRTAFFHCVENEVAYWADARIARMAMEQLLIKNSIQYDSIINDCMDNVDNYDLLVCANTITVSEKIVKRIAEFVRKGGKLLCTEMSFTQDEHGRKRSFSSDMGLEGERDMNIGRSAGASGRAEILDYLGLDHEYLERIFYVPIVNYSKTFQWDPRSSSLPHIGKEYFTEPLNKQEILESLRQALEKNDVEIKSPENVIAGLFDTVDGKRVLHVLDYEAGRDMNGISVRFKANNQKNTTAKFITFDGETNIEIKHDGTHIKCVLPRFKTYGFLVT